MTTNGNGNGNGNGHKNGNGHISQPSDLKPSKAHNIYLKAKNLNIFASGHVRNEHSKFVGYYGASVLLVKGEVYREYQGLVTQTFNTLNEDYHTDVEHEIQGHRYIHTTSTGMAGITELNLGEENLRYKRSALPGLTAGSISLGTVVSSLCLSGETTGTGTLAMGASGLIRSVQVFGELLSVVGAVRLSRATYAKDMSDRQYSMGLVLESTAGMVKGTWEQEAAVNAEMAGEATSAATDTAAGGAKGAGAAANAGGSSSEVVDATQSFGSRLNMGGVDDASVGADLGTIGGSGADGVTVGQTAGAIDVGAPPSQGLDFADIGETSELESLSRTGRVSQVGSVGETAETGQVAARFGEASELGEASGGGARQAGSIGETADTGQASARFGETAEFGDAGNARQAGSVGETVDTGQASRFGETTEVGEAGGRTAEAGEVGEAGSRTTETAEAGQAGGRTSETAEAGQAGGRTSETAEAGQTGGRTSETAEAGQTGGRTSETAEAGQTGGRTSETAEAGQTGGRTVETTEAGEGMRTVESTGSAEDEIYALPRGGESAETTAPPPDPLGDRPQMPLPDEAASGSTPDQAAGRTAEAAEAGEDTSKYTTLDDALKDVTNERSTVTNRLVVRDTGDGYYETTSGKLIPKDEFQGGTPSRWKVKIVSTGDDRFADLAMVRNVSLDDALANTANQRGTYHRLLVRDLGDGTFETTAGQRLTASDVKWNPGIQVVDPSDTTGYTFTNLVSTANADGSEFSSLSLTPGAEDAASLLDDLDDTVSQSDQALASRPLPPLPEEAGDAAGLLDDVGEGVEGSVSGTDDTAIAGEGVEGTVSGTDDTACVERVR